MLEKVLGIFKTAHLFKASSVWNTCDLLGQTGTQPVAGTLCACCVASLSFHFPSLPGWGGVRSPGPAVSAAPKQQNGTGLRWSCWERLPGRGLVHSPSPTETCSEVAEGAGGGHGRNKRCGRGRLLAILSHTVNQPLPTLYIVKQSQHNIHHYTELRFFSCDENFLYLLS